MKEKIISKKRLVLTTTILSIVLLMGMNVSATVTYNQAKQLSIDSIKETVDRVINGRAYQRLYNYVHPKYINMYNETEQQEMYQRVITNMSPYFAPYFAKDPLYPGLVEFLQTICEAVCILLGHGVVGMGCAAMVCMSLALVASISIGFISLPSLTINLSILTFAFFFTFIDDIMLYNIGFIGAILFFCIVAPLSVLLLLFLIPIADIVMMVIVFIDTTDYI